MGRGRSGLMEQSMKKTKFQKTRTRTDFEIYRTLNPNVNVKNGPPLAIDHIIAQMRKMSPQDVMNLLLPSN